VCGPATLVFWCRLEAIADAPDQGRANAQTAVTVARVAAVSSSDERFVAPDVQPRTDARAACARGPVSQFKAIRRG